MGRPAGRCGALMTMALVIPAVTGAPTPPRVLIFSLGDDYGFVSRAAASPAPDLCGLGVRCPSSGRAAVSALSTWILIQVRGGPMCDFAFLLILIVNRTTLDIHTAQICTPTRRPELPH